jgi:mevalonate kinase
MKKIEISVPGKIHLMGEHAVVYGKPAILAAIGVRCYLTLEKTKRADTLELISNSYEAQETLSKRELQSFQLNIKKNWAKFQKSQNISELKNLTKDPLDFTKIAIIIASNYYRQNIPTGIKLTIDSQIPIGSGMGSSAAIAVGVAAILSLHFGKTLINQTINEIAYEIEKYKHGFPSGGDNTAVNYGGLIWFRKESDMLRITKPLEIKVSAKLSKNFYIINTGCPLESTGEMVAMVKNLLATSPKKVEKFLSDQEKVTRELLTAIQKSDEPALISLLKRGEKNLERIQVVSKTTQKLIRTIEASGGAAKICGAGGFATNSGIVLAYHQNKQTLKKIIKPFAYLCFKVKLGVAGIHIT